MKSNTAEIMGIKIFKLKSKDAFKKIILFSKEDSFHMIFTPNTEIVMMAQKSKEFKKILNSSDLNLPDGVGLLMASKIKDLGIKEKIAGIDFANKILDYCNKTGKSIFLLGGERGIAQIAADNIKKTYKNIEIKGTYHGYFEKKDQFKVIDIINEKKPDVIFVALGAPKQEEWIYKNRKLLNANIAMGVGGSIDIWAGKAKRAPKIFIKLGLEWLYRVLKQPARIKRIGVLPKFLIKIYYEKMNL